MFVFSLIIIDLSAFLYPRFSHAASAAKPMANSPVAPALQPPPPVSFFAPNINEQRAIC
jgi:hypothetical protein